jgi:hypothetical protein
MFNAGRASDARPTSRAGTPTAVYPDGTDARTSEPRDLLCKKIKNIKNPALSRD